MTKNQLEAKRIKTVGRLNEIAGLEGADFTDAIRTESETLSTEYRDSGVQLQAALVVEDAETASRRTRSGGAWLDCGRHREPANELELRGPGTGLARLSPGGGRTVASGRWCCGRVCIFSWCALTVGH